MFLSVFSLKAVVQVVSFSHWILKLTTLCSSQSFAIAGQVFHNNTCLGMRAEHGNL